MPYDVGAEAFLARRPEVPRAARPSWGWPTRRCTRPPAAAVGPGGRAHGAAARRHPARRADQPGPARRAALRRPGSPRWPPSRVGRCAGTPGADVALGALLRARFGDELADRLVDPLLGGVYAGRVDALGLRATVPALAAALDAGARVADRAPPTPRRPGGRDRRAGGPVFGALRGGYRVLLDALAARGRAPSCGSAPPSGSCARRPHGWRLDARPGDRAGAARRRRRAARRAGAGGRPAAGRRRARRAAAAAAEIELASSVVVALAYRRGRRADAAADLRRAGRGRRAARGQGRHALQHQVGAPARADGLVRLRASLGRFGEAATLQVDDAELVARVRADLATLTGITAEPVAVQVQRWGGGLPQYARRAPRPGRARSSAGCRPGWRWPGPRCTASACRRASAPPGRRRSGWSRQLAGAAAARDGSMERMARLDYAELNSTIRYTMWSVFRVEPGRLGEDRTAAAAQAAEFLDALEGKGVVVRGVYDLAGHARRRRLHDLVARRRRRGAAGRLRRPAPRHRARAGPASRCGARSRCTARPSSTRATSRRSWPARSPSATSASTRSCARCDWYLLPDEERRADARRPRQGRPRLPGRAGQHGARRSRSATTSGSWPSRPTSCDRIVDLMRDLRATEARRHVREEVPFFTGPRVAVGRAGGHPAVSRSGRRRAPGVRETELMQ